MTVGASEREVLTGLLPQLEAEGYEVFIAPGPPLAPHFLDGITPDVIAIRDDKKLVVEIVGRNGNSGRLERLQRLVKDQPGWELRVIVVSPATAPVSLAVQPAEAIARQIDQVDRLVEAGVFSAALLLGWAAFEAAGRALMTDAFRYPQTASRLVEYLAGEGFLRPSEAARLRGIAKTRNALTHGELDAAVTPDDVRALVDVLRMLVGLVEERQANTSPAAEA
ncbi:hypothetical protein CCR97_26150 [Rhodoplanes elegans]|uniref:REase AHJR-like domain-containing protein n=1 Tax=Rhodoplanes elegans TaxID=29408 RepID=A0A327K5N6_9BRAD|nr:hypothetical protein [Rhodoplanes elegans]MBK5961661.1 hypothetical protein [Rhodoplanes elegans]RAI33025.1 hypothetical protein CH338_23225 [Rhodoplanes elegans]